MRSPCRHGEDTPICLCVCSHLGSMTVSVREEKSPREKPETHTKELRCVGREAKMEQGVGSGERPKLDHLLSTRRGHSYLVCVFCLLGSRRFVVRAPWLSSFFSADDFMSAWWSQGPQLCARGEVMVFRPLELLMFQRLPRRLPFVIILRPK